MLLLEYHENIELQRIIENYPGIDIERTRINLLKLSGIYECVNLEVGGSKTEFVRHLIAELLDPDLKTEQGKPVLVPLLSYVRFSMENRLTEDQHQFLNNVTERYQNWCDHPDSGKATRRKIWETQRQKADELPNSVDKPVKMNFRRKLLTEYDLDLLTRDFKRSLVPGNAFGFIIAGSLYPLSTYVIERLYQEFEAEMKGEPCSPPPSIDLNEQDLQTISVENLLEEKIKHRFNYEYAHELVTKRSKQHVILTVWNHDLPIYTLQQAVITFWQRFIPTIIPHLTKKRLCFVLILAHLTPESQPCQIEHFTTLELPPFDVKGELLPWITRRLDMLSTPNRERRHCEAQFQDLQPDPNQVLLRLNYVISYLENQYESGRYNEKKPRPRRRPR